MTFKALVLTKEGTEVRCGLQELDDTRLPEADVTVRIEYSTVNYKDGLAITGAGPVVRSYPMVPGIDFAGVVSASGDAAWQPGRKVVLNGWGVGERHWGGLSQAARVPGDWLVALPDALTTRQAMMIGTAGYTAMLCVMALQRQGLTPDQGEIAVTGAAGGVGSTAVALLAGLGYRVAAVTGRPGEADYLQALGARAVIDRAELAQPGKPLAKERWAGAIDCVGSHTLANLLAGTAYGGVVACCGLAQGPDLPATVMPFILRGVQLVGVDSVMAPMELRRRAWARLARDLNPDQLERMATEIGLDQVEETARAILRGQVRGRVVVDVNR